jgi:predicted ATP-grasp superfamily ATP-dependent carboligase
MYRILVPDAETRKVFDIISILTSVFPDVPMICGNTDGTESMKHHLERIFKGKAEVLRTNDAEQCVEDFNAIAEKYKDDQIVFVPAEEKTIAYLYQFVKKCGKKNYVYILPKEEVYNTLRDKKGLNDYCAEHKLSAPAHYTVAEIDTLKPEQYPILLKPCIGSGSEGQYRLYKPEDYKKIPEEVKKEPYLVQELIPNGHDVQGTFYLYNNGTLVEAYSHQRLRTSPPTGGVTVLSKLHINTPLIAEGQRILDSIGWNGLIMLEFLLDERTGKYKVIEANPRVWGSIMLSEYSGRNLLTNYVRLCMDQMLVMNYRTEPTYIRWFFPVDVLNYVKKLGRIKGFWNFKNTCFINWSYASTWSAVQFNLSNLFSIKNIKRLFRH